MILEQHFYLKEKVFMYVAEGHWREWHEKKYKKEQT